MIKRIKVLLFAFAVCFVMSGPAASASPPDTSSTYYTYSPSITNDRYYRSQDGFLPRDVLLLGQGLSEPQDIYYYKDSLYIADTGNKRIVIYNLKDKSVKTIEGSYFEKPAGVAVDSDGKIYVADNGKSAAYRFSPEGQLEQTYGKPDSPAFGKSSIYKPMKIAPLDNGGVYVVGEGAYSGVIHMNSYGEFLGYFASNNIKMGVSDILKQMFFTSAQKESLMKKRPASFGNIMVGPDGFVYTLTDGSGSKIKKHNISGLNMLPEGLGSDWSNIVDITVTDKGVFYTVSQDGYINEFTSDGLEIQFFGGTADGIDRVGLISEPSGIAVDENNCLYVLDKGRGVVQKYEPAQITLDIHNAIRLYNDGKYSQSREVWQNVLKLNNMSRLAHIGIGKAYLQEEDYANALEHFRIAGEKSGYSTAYWEIRNDWLNRNAGTVIIIILVFAFILSLIKRLNKRFTFLEPVKSKMKNFSRIRYIRDIKAMRYSLVHPMDTCYEIKYGGIGTIASATSIYAVMFIEYVLLQVASGFLFSSSEVQNYPLFANLLAYVSLVILWVSGNYLISSINEGEGSLRTVYISSAYILSPAVMFLPIVIVMSNFLTLGEAFLVSLSFTVISAWCIIRLYVTVMEVHDYSNKETIKNILLTLFFIVVAVLALSIVYMLVSQVYDFIMSIVMEVMARA